MSIYYFVSNNNLNKKECEEIKSVLENKGFMAAVNCLRRMPYNPQRRAAILFAKAASWVNINGGVRKCASLLHEYSEGTASEEDVIYYKEIAYSSHDEYMLLTEGQTGVVADEHKAAACAALAVAYAAEIAMSNLYINLVFEVADLCHEAESLSKLYKVGLVEVFKEFLENEAAIMP